MAEKKTEDLILEARDFFNSYKKEIGRNVKEGKNVIYIDFNELASFSHELAELLCIQPEDILQVLEVALEESGLIKNPRVRFLSLPETHSEKIRNLRAKHLNKMIQVDGLVRQASEVRPQVVNAKFECPSCGTIISVLQLESKFREPNRCSCGRKGSFKLVSKDMVDAQRLVIEESPESLIGGEQPRRISVFLKEDLVEPKMEEKTTPGSKIRVIGILKEIPRLSQAGGILTRYDIALEANNIIPLEETFEELDISEEDERQIRELAADPKVFEKFIESIAPSVYGYEEIKKSLVLQLFGGIKKIRSDGTHSRGDIHVLLVGDPGVAKSVTLKFIANIAPKGRYVAGRGTSLDYSEPLLIKVNTKQKFVKIGEFVDKFYQNNETGFVTCFGDIEALSLNLNSLKLEWKPIKAVFRHEINENLLSFNLETGRKIKVTKDHSIFCAENGEIKCKPSKELKIGDYVMIPKIIPTNEFDLSEEIAKFLGYFIAEGHLYNKDGSYKIQFTLNKDETEIASEIKVIAEKYLQKEVSIKQHGKNAIRLTIYGKEPYLTVCSWLGSLAHKTAKEKGVPEIILNSNQKARQVFLESYIRGDSGVTKSGRLMSEILYMQLQDKIIASCVEAKMNKTSIIEGRTIQDIGSRFDLKSPKINRQFKNLRLNFPIACLPENLKIFFKKKMKSGYLRINLERIDNHMLFERLMRVFREEKISGKRIRQLFGENSIEYFTEHPRLFLNKKVGREIEIALTSKGIETIKDILKLRKLLESDVSFVKIKKIEEVKQEYNFVYDISTPENENFVAGFGGIICHNTGAGLTATVVRDEFLRGWSLEAGAMVLANKGLVCVDEIEKMDEQDRSAMHEAMEQQCYLPKFKIMLADNSKIEIGQFVDKLMEKNKNQVQKGNNCEILPIKEDIKVLTTDFETIYPTRIDRISKHVAPEKFVKIKLVNGRELVVTKEHPCWIVKDGKIITTSAENLMEGEFFPIPGELPINGEEQTFDIKPYKNGPALCKLIGYHITDGCYELNRGIKNGIQFCNNNKNLIEDYIDSIKKIFYISPTITKRNNQFSVRVVSKKVIEFIRNLDKNLLEKGKFKKIPEKIMKCRKEDITFLLRAIFDGDGTVVNVKRNGCRISLITENIELAEQVNELLLRFAILSSVYKDKEFFKVDICGQENILKFFNNIGFLAEKKQNRLKNYLEKQKTYRSISDIVPNVTETIKRIFKHLKINEERDLGNQVCMNCNKHRLFLQRMVRICEEKINKLVQGKKIIEKTANSFELGKIRKMLEFSVLGISKKLGISNYMLKQYEEKNIQTKVYQNIMLKEIENILSIIPKLEEIKKLAFGEIRWSKIKSVEIIDNKDIKWVYDITVEPTHSFISNNMVLHNSVTISKANVQASLRAETSVLAAANPKFGRFDPYQTVASQIDIPPTLINRFDVIFILKDNPDRARDEAIATHVLLEHQKPEVKAPIEKELFRKYIAYAKQKIQPKLIDEAVDEIKKFYVDLRNTPVSLEQPTKPLPISARQLEALIRLSEASAKIRLSKKITKHDADVAIDLMKYYLMQVGYDYETKTFDIDRIATGVSTSQRGRILLVRETLVRLESRLGKLIPVEEIKKELEGKMEDKDIDEALDKLTISGDIFHPRKGFVQRM